MEQQVNRVQTEKNQSYQPSETARLKDVKPEVIERKICKKIKVTKLKIERVREQYKKYRTRNYRTTKLEQQKKNIDIVRKMEYLQIYYKKYSDGGV